eukprot:15365884-Ditylum_brightwellii.AAC.1
MQKIVKCKQVSTTERKINLIEALCEGDALAHWLEFKQVKTTRTSKKPDGLDTLSLGMSGLMFKI